MPLFPRAKITRSGRYRNYALGMAVEVAAILVIILAAFTITVLLFLLGKV